MQKFSQKLSPQAKNGVPASPRSNQMISCLVQGAAAANFDELCRSIESLAHALETRRRLDWDGRQEIHEEMMLAAGFGNVPHCSERVCGVERLIDGLGIVLNAVRKARRRMFACDRIQGQVHRHLLAQV